jgi:predicted DsbA family dithiol-disulfide isomerase
VDYSQKELTMKRIVITNFTDPVCVWCWGSEPVFRALETHYPDFIEFRYICGGLVENIDDFADDGNGINGGAEGANKQVASHWLEASSRHRMPVRTEDFHLFSKEYPSTYPQNIAYKAAQIASPELADGFLRRLREATLGEAKVTSKTEVQIELASEVGIDIGKFMKALTDGSAEKKFHADLAMTRSLGVSGFPTFLIKTSQGKQVMVRGYQDFVSFSEVLSYLSDGELKPIQVTPNEETLNELFTHHRKLAREEVFQAFDFDSRKQADEWIDQLITNKTVTKELVGNSYYIAPVKTLYCNVETGMCE